MKKEINNPETSVEYANKCGSYKQRKIWKKNGVEIIVDNDGIFWLNQI